MKETLGFIYWLYCVCYAFAYWSMGWGIFNLFIPSAPVYDLVVKIGRIQ